ncbi:MAG: MaoC family dehydratase [Burkholderiales bacterium]|nr:MaoC family dehydratase [Burkholderiales bacterium]
MSVCGLPEFRLHATPESVARWCIGRDGTLAPPPAEGDALPLAYLVFLRVQPILGLSIHRHLARDPDRGLYGGVTYAATRTPRVGEAFVATAEVTSRREVESPRGTMVLRSLATTYRDGAGPVVTETVRMVDLPAGPPADPARGPARPPAHEPVAVIAPLTRTQVAWLTVETGDMNALHLDIAYAAARRYPNVVIPGTLTVALIERELAKVLGRPLARIDLRLTAASYPGEEYRLHAAAKGDGLGYELFCGEELRAEGSAA